MSTTPLDLPILISQLPFVQKIAHAEVAKPDVQQLLFGPLITENLRKNQEKIQQIGKREKTNPVDRDGQQRGQPHGFSERKESDKEEESPETGSSTASPWSGNIVNIKI